MIGWMIFAAYCVAALLVARPIVRRVFVAEQARFPRSASEYRNGDLGIALMVGGTAGAVWPLALVALSLFALAKRSVPEYVSAELDDRITEQRAELDKPHRQMRIPPVDWDSDRR